MNKKIIAVALLILMISVVFISCGKREAGKRTILQPLPPKQRPLNTQPMNRAKNS